MKRKKGRRGAELRRNSPLRKVNPEAQAKRRKRYQAKLSAYRRSETYKIVEARAGGRCEAMDTHVWKWSSKTGMAKEPATVEPYRCYADRRYPDGTKLTHHHKTYARFGGAERPDDIIVLCPKHNALAESEHPTRNRNYRKAS